MTIAVATENNSVAAHFGHCPEYTLVELEDGKIKDQRVIPNPGHEPGFLPGYLARLGVTCIIAGGMGSRAQTLFAVEKIETFVGISGPVHKVISDYLSGALKTGTSICDHEGCG
ncbi:MAG: NifB/NifX family molybdenum-iron cluster-binding protein [Bacillota bacterium]